MSGPSFKVFLETNSGFTLDSGMLDVDRLGFLQTELTGVQVRSVETKQGKERELGKFTPGTCTLVLDNRDRAFDPSYTASPYYGSIYPGRKITIWQSLLITDYIGGGGSTISYGPFWSGYITDWDFDFDPSGDATATIRATDGLSVLATTELNNVSVPAELTGTRVKRILNNAAVAFPSASQVIYPGVSTLAAGTATGNALQYLQDVTFNEQGALYTDPYGNLNFVQRNLRTVFFNVAFGGATGIPYESIDMTYSNDSIINNVTATAAVGTATATNQTSVATYQRHTETFDMMYSSQSELSAFGNYIVDIYGTPELRVNSITINLLKYWRENLSTEYELYEILANLRIGVVSKVTVVPAGYTEASAIVFNPVTVISISRKITPSRYDLTIGFEKNPGINAFTLDDSIFGTLSTTNTLAF